MIASGALPPHRIALVAPGARDEWYSASPLYAGALVRGVLPAVAAEVAVRGEPVAIGASLGALAMLHAQHRTPARSPGCSCSPEASSRPSTTSRSGASRAGPA